MFVIRFKNSNKYVAKPCCKDAYTEDLAQAMQFPDWETAKKSVYTDSEEVMEAQNDNNTK